MAPKLHQLPTSVWIAIVSFVFAVAVVASTLPDMVNLTSIEHRHAATPAAPENEPDGRPIRGRDRTSRDVLGPQGFLLGFELLQLFRCVVVLEHPHHLHGLE